MLRIGRLDDGDEAGAPSAPGVGRTSLMPAYIAGFILLVLAADLVLLTLRT